MIRALISCVAVAALLAGCGDGDDTPTGPSLPTTQFTQTDLVVGSGATAALGRTVTVNYSLWLYDPARPDSKGQLLQTTVGGSPASFPLASGQVIAGWVQGVPGMRVGGQRRLIIPPSLAYGSAGAGSGPGSVPPNATLVFDIELLAVQ